ncbi:AAA family ATPase [Arenibacter algicola]|uniref:AbiJ-related protein n=1 Tax=Arenibacter algicola TaxID=616991 RepID=UPI001C0664BF|nr:AAA family ATPase [Arenibacter algicola]MBU2905108.1 AAA family ATPase [Arenibacter algicola]
MGEFSINEKNKLQLFSAIRKERNPFGEFEDGNGYLNFLERIWDLSSMPSEDSRYEDALREIIQHTINNDDYDEEYLFIERLKLTKDDEAFVRFLQTVISPDFRKNEDEIIKFVLLINQYLEKDTLELYLNEYNDDGLPLYIIRPKTKENASIYIKHNNIPFHVDKTTSYSFDRGTAHNRPVKYPSFVLAHNSGWNDHKYYTLFYLFYYDVDTNRIPIGSVKVMDEEENKTTVIPDSFESLNTSFCSLGQSSDYYKNLKEVLGRNFESVLYALKDCAFFLDIQEKFEKKEAFRQSLIRVDRAERLLREARYIVYDYDLSNLYSFNYSFKPIFSKEPIDVEFNFNNSNEFSNRIYGIIGKNGAGKTQLITHLPKDISNKKNESFSPKTPFFSKVITVSYSVFDNFEIPSKTASFNYVYCGIRNDKGEINSERGLLLRFHNTWKRIEELDRIIQWRDVLLNFIDEELVDQFIVPAENGTQLKPKFEVDITDFSAVRKKLSSGQGIILFIITEIVANIRYDSLLLFDEPETHLHPNAITQLVNTIYNLVEEFESYCIITTHSPLIIRELFSKNVYVIEKHENVPSIRRIGIESFGEDSSVLTEEVFGNKEIIKHYKTKIKEFVSAGYSYNAIVSQIEFDQIPLSLNAKIYIKSLIKNNDA